MSLKEFGDILKSMREQCFHMNDDEVSVIVDEFIDRYPQLINFQPREWFIKNS
jgi:hypothetical protein